MSVGSKVLTAETSVLIVDDEPTILSSLSRYLTNTDYSVDTAACGEDAISLAERFHYEVALLDVAMPGINGIDVLQELKRIDPAMIVIIMTSFGSVGNAVTAMKLGADDYLLKPLKLQSLAVMLGRIADRHRRTARYDCLLKNLHTEAGKGEVVTCSRMMAEVVGLVEKIGPLPSTVLIQGESGTGKELVARSIHTHSPRASHRFVAINCGVIPMHLLESELFGYERGAFTGAEARKLGYFEIAAGGSLFLDEVSEMPLELQVKLLRVLQERTFQRLGGTDECVTDVRVIASTNRDLDEEVRAGRFRKDLFYRINVIKLTVPPLRERTDDIPLLAHYFLRKYSVEFRKPVRDIQPEVLDVFLHWRWEGNVRELENVIERAVAVVETDSVSLKDLPPMMRNQRTKRSAAIDIDLKPFATAKDHFEREYLEVLLRRAEGNISQASRLASIPRPNLYEKLKKHGMQGPHQHAAVPDAAM